MGRKNSDNNSIVSINNSNILDNPKPSNSKEIDEIPQNQIDDDELFDFKSTTSSEETEIVEKKSNKKRGQNIKIGELNKIDTSVKTIIKEAKKIGVISKFKRQ